MSRFTTALGLAMVLTIVIALTQAQPEPGGGTTPPTDTTTGTPTTPTTPTTSGSTTTSNTTWIPHTGRTTCRPVGTCPPNSPRICARNPSGMCRRFADACQLERTNCAPVGPIQSWRRTAAAECTAIRPGATMARCVELCPRRCVPPPPPPPTASKRLCLRSKDRKKCRVVASKCQQQNLNCRSNPRRNWSVANAALCRDMKVGRKARRCTARN